jgi:hypothetical protein
MIFPLGKKFELLVEKILHALHFTITNIDSESRGEYYSPDLRLEINGYTVDCEVKFYRSNHAPHSVIRKAAQLLAEHNLIAHTHKILIVSSLVPVQLKNELSNSYNMILWDRSNLFSFLKQIDQVDLLEEFTTLLIQAQQGPDGIYPFDSVDTANPDVLSYFSDSFDSSSPVRPNFALTSYKFENIDVGKMGWRDFEKQCASVLRYLFENDLSIWKEQQITDDELSRFDMLCRVTSQDDFWGTLVNAFSSRYILFEFKNFTDKISQHQIYLTERYLYPKALRGTAIVIARNGADDGAIATAKGALREHGKLILLLSQSDLEKMIELKESGDSPNDYLSEMLDTHLISLSR